jgi:hypothetical protein
MARLVKIKTKTIWDGGGYLYDDGDVPECNFCNEDANYTAIYSTAHSGVLVCADEKCLLEYCEHNIKTDELIATSIEVEHCGYCEEECDECICEEDE